MYFLRFSFQLKIVIQNLELPLAQVKFIFSHGLAERKLRDVSVS